MAEGAAVSFGHYLRDLRKRRGLSLLAVSRLSQTGPEAIDKGTLSRYEHGKQRLPLSTLIPLSRLYSVPAEVLLERLELDKELEAVGAPDTEQKSCAELDAHGKEALGERDAKWEAYACFRDALLRADDVAPEQASVIRMNLATASRALGKNRLALHELTALEESEQIGAPLSVIVLDRIANCYRCLGDDEAAERYLTTALAQASYYQDHRAQAFAYYSKAALVLDHAVSREGIELLQKAFRANRNARHQASAVRPNPTFEVNTLLRLSDTYLHLGFYEKGGRAALTAKRLAAAAEFGAGQAYAEITLGEIDEAGGSVDRALQRWEHAAQMAAVMHNKRLEFTARFFIFRDAVRRGAGALADVSRQKLNRLTPWIAAHVPLREEFEDLCASHRTRSRKTTRKAN